MNGRLWGVLISFLGLGVLLSSWSILRPDSSSSRSGRVLGSRTDAQISELHRPPVQAEPVLTAPPPLIRARSAVVIDGGSGQLLLAKEGHQSVPIASTTKVMTAVVLLESGRDLESSVSVSQAAGGQTGSILGLRPGESLTLKELLAGLLIMSGNDAAYVIAESFGSVDTFVKQMNDTAVQLGLIDTEYFDPAGLDDRGRSTPFDLATLLRYALTFSEFQAAASTPEKSIVSSAGNRYDLKNSNRLVRSDQPLFMPDVLAGKTGFTPDAGHCLVSAARRDGHLLVSVVLHTDEDTPEASAAESRRLLDWTFAHTQWRE